MSSATSRLPSSDTPTPSGRPRPESPLGVVAPRSTHTHWFCQDRQTVALVGDLEVTIDSRGVAFGHQLTVTIGRENVVSLFITGGHFMHWLVVKAPVDCPIETYSPYDDSEEEMKRHMDAFFGCFHTPAVVEFVKSFLGIK